MDRLTIWIVALMIITAALGTGWYIWVELSTKGSVSSIGWSIIAVVWFVIIRRLIYLRRR